MGWICKNCGTNNEKEDEICIACGQSKSTGRIDCEYSVPVESYSSSTRRWTTKSITQIGCSFLIVFAFVLGQLLTFISLSIKGNVFVLSTILEYFGVEIFDLTLFVEIMSVVAALASGLIFYDMQYFVKKIEPTNALMIAVPFSIVMSTIPSLVAVEMLIFATIITSAKTKFKIKKILMVYTIFMVISMIVFSTMQGIFAKKDRLSQTFEDDSTKYVLQDEQVFALNKDNDCLELEL